MHQVAPHFQVVIWRSLRDAPICEVLLDDCLQVLSPQPLREVPTSLEQRLGLLLEHLRQTRTLLVLDNLEVLLEEGEGTGRMRSGYEGYARLLRRVAETMHQSCLLLTSREKPAAQYRLDKENDALNALEGLDELRPWVASRTGEKHDHLRKGVLQFGHVPVFGTGARELRARLLADARITAQATQGQQGIAQISKPALGQVFALLGGRLLEFMQGISDQGDGMSETEPITVQTDLLGGLQHEGAHGIVAQKDAIELLLDPIRGLRTQGVITEALVRIEVVDSGLDFPALVRAQDQGSSPNGARIEQGGDR
ncbi:MAG: hypothetical protein AUI36_44345 [Cyanobacteria bacterium 13_1_40CM_2_61_4]|nr:MAG: hypothetical protein AUI36_44345 [Cyanobacteria bacterium 13_1_40CM_2_61_4]